MAGEGGRKTCSFLFVQKFKPAIFFDPLSSFLFLLSLLSLLSFFLPELNIEKKTRPEHNFQGKFVEPSRARSPPSSARGRGEVVAVAAGWGSGTARAAVTRKRGVVTKFGREREKRHRGGGGGKSRHAIFRRRRPLSPLRPSASVVSARAEVIWGASRFRSTRTQGGRRRGGRLG